ncbi:MAG: sulfite exporter TauE/SafE family protein [Synechococcales cyanobacterium CRU_2_2]|nr:sulfite exporter TauE/SafE family protein [Synechococcales cyanobacterium CRU_2_2]
MAWISLLLGGLVAGVLAGLLGIGGGTILVPILLATGAVPVQAIATSSLAIIITSLSGSVQNWRMGLLDFQQIAWLGLPAIAASQIGVQLASGASDQWLLIAFGVLMLVNLALLSLRQQLVRTTQTEHPSQTDRSYPRRSCAIGAKILTGGLAGMIAGLLGVGGGAIMVPLQMLLLQEPIKRAIQTSLGVVVLTAIASTAGHAVNGNVLWLPGLILGVGGLVSAQLSTRLLPRLPDRWVSALFRAFLLLSALYSFGQAFQER